MKICPACKPEYDSAVKSAKSFMDQLHSERKESKLWFEKAQLWGSELDKANARIAELERLLGDRDETT